jgi:hypothetical protein
MRLVMPNPKGTFRTYPKIKLEVIQKEKEYHETYPFNHLNVHGIEDLVGIQVICTGCYVRVE